MNYSQLKNEIRDQIELVLALYWSSAGLPSHQPEPGQPSDRRTSVMFNGVPAAFTAESDTYMRATAPTGATTSTASAAVVAE